MLLGELAVDQRAYAEVGTPVAARVTRLLVNAGDAVRSGQTLAELTSPELGRERAEYLSASARLKLAEAALERKRGLAAEKIVPLREVQEAESAAGEARAALRASRAAIAAFGVEPPADDGDGATSSAFVLALACCGLGDRAHRGRRSDARSGGAGFPHRQSLDAVADRSRVRARRRSHSAGCRCPPVVSRPSRTGLRRNGDDGRTSRRERIANGPRRIDVKNSGNLLRPGMSATATLPVGATGARHPDGPGRVGSTCSQRMVRVPAEGREPFRNPTHRPWPRSRRRSGGALRPSCRRERSSSMAPSCSRLRQRRARRITMPTETRHD